MHNKDKQAGNVRHFYSARKLSLSHSLPTMSATPSTIWLENFEPQHSDDPTQDEFRFWNPYNCFTTMEAFNNQVRAAGEFWDDPDDKKTPKLELWKLDMEEVKKGVAYFNRGSITCECLLILR